VTQQPQVLGLPVSFDTYIRHGWFLVPMPSGTKGPTATATLGNLVQAAAVATAPAVPVENTSVATVATTHTAPAPNVAAAAPLSNLPTAPMFTAAPTPAAPALPFNDGKGLVEYVMAAYKAMGPEKGANIQGVLVNLGYQNINDVKPEHYAQVHAGIEALK